MRELLKISARALGVAAEADLRDYFRLPAAESRKLIAELAEQGDIEAVTVEGWPKAAYMFPDAELPRRIRGTALLTPFDPIVWERRRTERLFNFHYRIEIYTPRPQATVRLLCPSLPAQRISGRPGRPEGGSLIIDPARSGGIRRSLRGHSPGHP